MPTPHQTWAQYYDLVNERTMGPALSALTESMLDIICRHVSPPRRIVDFGAGSGRLAVPLAQRGFDVVAVEPCNEMLDAMAAKPGAEKIERVNARMQDYCGEESFDLALCVFNVIFYIVEERDLEQSITAAADALKPGGLFLLDIPRPELIQGNQELVHTFFPDRHIVITELDADRQLYNYREDTQLTINGESHRYSDEFPIRIWSEALVRQLLERNGLRIEEDLSGQFYYTGASYLLLKKI